MAALKESEPIADPDVFTRQELCDMLGIKRTTMQARIQALLRDGKATRTTKRLVSVAGFVTTVPAYKLVKYDPIRKKK